MSNNFNANNLVSLELENISHIDSDVKLFAYEPNGAYDTIYKTSFPFYPTVQINLHFEGLPYLDTFSAPSIKLLVDDLNVFYARIFVFTYKLISGNNFYLYAFSLDDRYILDSIYSNNFYYFTEHKVIKGSTVIIKSNEQNFTYEEINSDFLNQPTQIDKINVYTSNISQLTVNWQTFTKESNGIVSNNLQMPIVDPMQKQYAIENIPLNFQTNPLSYINYRVNGNENVKVFFFYKNIDVIQSVSKVEAEIEAETQPIQKIENKIYPTMKNPMILLVSGKNKSIKSKISIKEIFSVKNRTITADEVFNAFDNSDFKVIDTMK